MQRFRPEAPEVPDHVRVLHVGLWVALLGVDERRELHTHRESERERERERESESERERGSSAQRPKGSDPRYMLSPVVF